MRRADGDVSAAIISLRTPALDRAAQVTTHFGGWPAHVAVMGSTAAVSARNGDARPFVYSVVSMAGTSATYVGLKHLLGRERPTGAVALVAVRDPSFPSGHTATAAAAARTLAELYDLPKMPLALASLTVAASRVYLGVHHPSDVVAGWLLGWTWASVWARILRPGANRPEAGFEAAVGPNLGVASHVGLDTNVEPERSADSEPETAAQASEPEVGAADEAEKDSESDSARRPTNVTPLKPDDPDAGHPSTG